ncbi:MAG: NAD(P)/FAD-dependent oxidoreductase [Armatimonadota bacterium]
MERMGNPVVVVGAGAAGIIAAWKAATDGARVILLEKTPRIGTKILISGGGKCNITHAGPVEEVLKEFRVNEARFLRPSFYRFTNEDVLHLLTDRGLQVYTRPNGRVFPVEQTAKDVVAVLERLLDEVGVQVILESPITKLIHTDGQVRGVETPAGEIKASHVVLSTGGSSYPKSGTTGDGWPWARELGHRVVPVRAALAPIELPLEQGAEWAGVSLRDVTLKARANGKEVARWREDLLFTHHGISGPNALGISREVEEAKVHHEVALEVDLLPIETFEQLQQRLQRYKQQNPNRRAIYLVDSAAPAVLQEPILIQARIDPYQICQSITSKQINILAETLKSWKLGKVSRVPIEKGEVVAGGIDLNEVDPKTMLSKKAQHLSICGEVLDVAGPVGGYNLQAAFSTGFVAGESAVKTVIS